MAYCSAPWPIAQPGSPIAPKKKPRLVLAAVSALPGDSIAFTHTKPLRTHHAQLGLFFFLDDDAWRDHHHQTDRFAADTDVLKEAVDVRNLS